MVPCVSRGAGKPGVHASSVAALQRRCGPARLASGVCTLRLDPACKSFLALVAVRPSACRPLCRRIGVAYRSAPGGVAWAVSAASDLAEEREDSDVTEERDSNAAAVTVEEREDSDVTEERVSSAAADAVEERDNDAVAGAVEERVDSNAANGADERACSSTTDGAEERENSTAAASTAHDADMSWLYAAHGRQVPNIQRWFDTKVRRHAAGNPTGLAVTWLGTSSGAPTLNRNNSGIALRVGAGDAERIMLVDVGEGSRFQFEALGLDVVRLTHVLLTHHHGDHCFGLPGLLQARHLEQLRQGLAPEPLTIYGPPGTAELVLASCMFTALPGCPEPPRVRIAEWSLAKSPALERREVRHGGAHFALLKQPADQTHPRFQGASSVQQFAAARRPGTSGRGADVQVPVYNGLTWTVPGVHGFRVQAAQLHHRVPCWGYVFTEPPVAAAPGAAKVGGGRKVCLLGDTCDSRAIAPLAHGCDVLSHEATFLQAMASKASVATHSTGWQAGHFASRIEARQLVLTHFSGRYSGGEAQPSARVEDQDEEEQVGDLQRLRAEAARAAKGVPIACAFDGFTWRVPERDSEGGEGQEGGASDRDWDWVAAASCQV